MSSSNDAAPAIDELIERADNVIARATTYERQIDAVEPLLPPEHPDLLSKFLQAQEVAVAIRAEVCKVVLKLKDLKLQEASSTVPEWLLSSLSCHECAVHDVEIFLCEELSVPPGFFDD